MPNIEVTAKNALLTLIREQQEKYPPSLKVKNVMEIMNCCKSQAYESINKGLIPGAKKIPGLGWRVNRDMLLIWIYASEHVEEEIIDVTSVNGCLQKLGGN